MHSCFFVSKKGKKATKKKRKASSGGLEPPTADQDLIYLPIPPKPPKRLVVQAHLGDVYFPFHISFLNEENNCNLLGFLLKNYFAHEKKFFKSQSQWRKPLH